MPLITANLLEYKRVGGEEMLGKPRVRTSFPLLALGRWVNFGLRHTSLPPSMSTKIIYKNIQ